MGPRTAERLAGIGLERLEDLLVFAPRRYDDAGDLRAIGALVPGERAYVEGVVRRAVVRRFFRRATLEVTIADDSGAVLLRWFRFRGEVPDRFAVGARVRAAGLVRAGKRGLELIQPVAEQVGAAGAALRPRYALPTGISGRLITDLAAIAVTTAQADPAGVPDDLPALREAARVLHVIPPLPDADGRAALAAGTHPAQRRAAFEELLLLRLRARRTPGREVGVPLSAAHDADRSLAPLLAAAPFSPTAAQLAAVSEIARDLARAEPMRRLLTGDVGSGKTWVAAAAIELACASKRRAAFLAPTSLLAEQQAATLRRLLAPTGRRVALLHGGTPRRDRRALEAALADPSGAVDVVVGTQALLDDALEIADLGLVVVDEQQRFGVAARAALVERAGRAAATPHQLALSATPIPRSLALALRGHVAVTQLAEKPPGRSPIVTEIVPGADAVARAIDAARAAIDAGEQVYWICSQIDAAPGARGVLEAAAAWEGLGLDVVVCHGRQTPLARGRAMAAFHAGAPMLVATTVVEVGLDVPGATLVVVESPGRLGLAQLHQLRGRVGRGVRPGRCLLVEPSAAASDLERLAVLVRTQAGLEIAEADLERRGMGDLFGVEQSGLPSLPPLGAAELTRLVERADRVAEQILKDDPALARAAHARLARALARTQQVRGAL